MGILTNELCNSSYKTAKYSMIKEKINKSEKVAKKGIDKG